MESKDMLTLIGIIVALSIGTINLVFTFILYKRNRTFENENFLYKMKFEKYSLIISELDKLMNYLYAETLKLHDSSFNIFTDTNLQADLADEVDKKIFEFNSLVVSCSMYCTVRVYDLLDDFDTALLDVETNYHNKEQLKIYFDVLYDKGNQINETIRHEMQLDELNASLYKRLKK